MENCKSCGEPLEQNAKFCRSCGSPANVEEQKTALAEASVAAEAVGTQAAESSPKKSFFKKPLFIGLVILLIGISGAAAAILLHKTPKELYLLAEYKTFQQTKEEIDAQYGDSFEFQEKMLEKPSSSELELSGDFEMDSAAGDPAYDMIREVLSGASLSLKTELDPKKNENHVVAGLNIENEEAINLNFTQTEDQLGFKVPVLHDELFYLDNDEFGELMRMTDPYYEGPETLEAAQLKWQDLKMTEKEQEYLQKRYTEFLVDRLKDENFEVQKGVKYEHKGEEMKLREVTLKLSASETESLVNAFMDHIVKDKQLHNMIIDRVEKVANATGEESMDSKDMKKELVDSLKEARDEMDDIDYPGVTSTILIDSKEQIIDRKVKIVIKDKAEILLTTKDVPYADDKEFQEFKFELKDLEQDWNATFLITNDVTAKNDKRNEKLNAEFAMEEYGENVQEFSFTMDSEIKGENGSKQDISREFEVGESENMPEISGTIKQKNDINLKKEYSKQEFAIDVDVEQYGETATIALNLDSDSTLKDKADIPDINDGVNILDISETELGEISEEIGMNLMELAEQYGIPMEDLYSSGASYDDSEYEDYEYDDYEYEEGL